MKTIPEIIAEIRKWYAAEPDKPPKLFKLMMPAEELLALCDSHDALEKKVTELKAEQDKVIHEREVIEKVLSQRDEDHGKLMAERDRLKAEVEQAKAGWDAAHIRSKAHQQAADNARAEVARLQKERDADARAFAKYVRKSEQQAAQLAEARKALAETESDYMAVRRSLLAERDSLKEALAGLMSYYPQYVTPDFRAAFEAAKKLTHENQDYK